MPVIPNMPSRRRTLAAARARTKPPASEPGADIKQEKQPTTGGSDNGDRLVPVVGSGTNNRVITSSRPSASVLDPAARARSMKSFSTTVENGRVVHTYGNDVPADQRRQVLSLAASRRARKRLGA